MTHPQKFDLIVIGAGAGGLNVASFMNAIGLRVLLIDKSDEHIGGDCLNAGCVPSKALLHIARQHHAAWQITTYGTQVELQVDMAAVMRAVRATQTIVREHESAAYFTAKGMTVVLGTATFAGTRSVMVNGQAYTADNIVLATGSRPRPLMIPGVEQVAAAGRLHTNESIFSLTTLPRRLLVIGGGPIGVELGQAFSHLGSQVTVMTTDSRLLPREDAAIAEVLTEQLIADGMVMRYRQQAVRFADETTLVVADAETGAEARIEFDAVLVAIGRVVDTTALRLEAAGIAVHDKGGIVVDRYLRTSNHHVYVCGDVAGQHQFTHAAELHAGVVIRNLLTPWRKVTLSTDLLSSVVYTTPEVATYGLSEATLKERRIAYTVLESTFADSDRAITDEARYGHTKMYVEQHTNRILGGTMVAPQAGELIQELILAMSARLPTSALFQKNLSVSDRSAYQQAGDHESGSRSTNAARQTSFAKLVSLASIGWQTCYMKLLMKKNRFGGSFS